MGPHNISRRKLIGLSVVGLGAWPRSGQGQESVPLHQGEAVPQTTRPVGGTRYPLPTSGAMFTTPHDNDPALVAVERKIRCTCGCLHDVYLCRVSDFSCGFWPQHHQDIVEQFTAGWSEKQIVDAYVSTYGESYLMAPPVSGFNLLGWFLPGVVLSFAAGLLVWRLNRLTPAAAPAQAREVDTEAQQRLDEEMRRLDL